MICSNDDQKKISNAEVAAALISELQKNKKCTFKKIQICIKKIEKSVSIAESEVEELKHGINCTKIEPPLLAFQNIEEQIFYWVK